MSARTGSKMTPSSRRAIKHKGDPDGPRFWGALLTFVVIEYIFSVNFVKECYFMTILAA